jgi:hypothetical protein
VENIPQPKWLPIQVSGWGDPLADPTQANCRNFIVLQWNSGNLNHAKKAHLHKTLDKINSSIKLLKGPQNYIKYQWLPSYCGVVGNDGKLLSQAKLNMISLCQNENTPADLSIYYDSGSPTKPGTKWLTKEI